MAIKFHDSPFHATHESEIASKLALKTDLSILITRLISQNGWTQQRAAEELGIQQSRVSDLKNSKIEKFTIDALFDLLDTLGYRAKLTMSTQHKASISIIKMQAPL